MGELRSPGPVRVVSMNLVVRASRLHSLWWGEAPAEPWPRSTLGPTHDGLGLRLGVTLRLRRATTDRGGGTAATELKLVPVPSRRNLFARMKPVINVEETVDRVVGKRTAPADPLKAGMALLELSREMHRSLKQRWAPVGVYRFRSHEEADAWRLRMLARSGLPQD